MLSGADWLRRISALTVAADGEGRAGDAGADAQEAYEAATSLARAATAYTASVSCEHDQTGTCALEGVPNGRELCDLALTLTKDDTIPRRVPKATERYLQALREAGPAVYYCRRFAHPAGTCWFVPQGDCGRVLAAAHRLS